MKLIAAHAAYLKDNLSIWYIWKDLIKKLYII